MHWQKTTSAMATQEGSEAGSAAKGSISFNDVPW